MNRIVAYLNRRVWLGWILVLGLALAAALLVGKLVLDLRQYERLDHLQTEAERRGVEIMSQTLNGNLMGAMAVLGLIDPDIKREALGKLPANNAKVLPILESIARSYDAEGVFVVAENGIAASSWDNSGKPSTGLNLKFRPYFQMAMQGMDNVYAAVSIARGDRSLYFSAPVFSETTNGTDAIGAVVARTNLLKVDQLLRDKTDIALLYSPQGVVFASSRAEWIGRLALQPSPQRLAAIRQIKQFGNMFNEKDPLPLPVSVETGLRELEGRTFAVASAKVRWNDPQGDWTLVLMEDLARSISLRERLSLGLAAGVAVLLMGLLFVRLLRSQQAQAEAAAAVGAFAAAQEASAGRKTQLATAAMAMQQTKSVEELGQRFFAETHRLFDALQGVLYLFEKGNYTELHLVARYACHTDPPAQLALGEGLLGQCALDCRLQVLDLHDERFVAIHSGLGSARPVALLMAPVLLNDDLLGAVEVALLRMPGEIEQEQFVELTRLLAMNVEIVGRNMHTEAMLSATVAAERAGAEQLLFQQALVDTIPYPVFYKGADTRFLGFNRAYAECFGVERASLVGKRVLDLDYLPEVERVAYQAEDEAVIASADSVRRETQIVFADGKPHDVLYFVSGFRRADGAPGGLVGTFIDISALKNAEREMDRMADMARFNRLAQGREQRVLELKREINAMAEAAGKPAPYNTSLIETIEDHEFNPHPDYRTELNDDISSLQLADLVDLDELQQLFSRFCETIGVAAAIINIEGKVLASARWQRACTDFHRINQASCARCIESDTELSLKLQDGQDFTMYQCKNGMTDCASPIIIEGHHLANVFIGQFHLKPPDDAFFRTQARQFGYDEGDYLQAVHEAPVMDQKRLPTILSFLTGFARMISTNSLARRRADLAQQALEQQAKLLQQERVAALSLAEDAAQARIALEAIAKESQA